MYRVALKLSANFTFRFALNRQNDVLAELYRYTHFHGYFIAFVKKCQTIDTITLPLSHAGIQLKSPKLRQGQYFPSTSSRYDGTFTIQGVAKYTVYARLVALNCERQLKYSKTSEEAVIHCCLETETRMFSSWTYHYFCTPHFLSILEIHRRFRI